MYVLAVLKLTKVLFVQNEVQQAKPPVPAAPADVPQYSLQFTFSLSFFKLS